MAKIQEDLEIKNWELFGEIGAAHVQLRARYRAVPLDRGRILAAYDQISALYRQAITNRVTAFNSAYELLTPDQKTQLSDEMAGRMMQYGSPRQSAPGSMMHP